MVIIMEQTVTEKAGTRLKRLRIALGYSKRPEFAEKLGWTQGHLSNIENLNGRLNEDHFHDIGLHYPWALNYLIMGGELVIPDNVDAPAKVISDMAAASQAAPASMDPQEFMKALTSDPEMKAAFQKMMIEILQQGLGSDGQ